MSFSDFFIKRPVFATSLNLLLLIIGLVAFTQLPVRQYPNINTSVITIDSNYPGASAALMEGFVTTPIENYVGQVDGIDYMTSSSTESSSSIDIYLNLGVDADAVLTNVQAQVSQALYQLPGGVQNPIIQKQDADSTPSMFIAFQSSKMNKEQITDYLLRVVQPQLQTLPGVQQAKILGERAYAMRMNVNPLLMAAHNVTPADLKNALDAQNVQAAAGSILSTYARYDILADTDMHTVDEFNNMLVSRKNDALVRFKEIGTATLGAQDYTSYSQINGRPAVTLGILTYANANPLKVSKAIRDVLPAIQAKMPTGLKATIVVDNSLFIRASMKEVMKSVLEAVFFVVLVMLLFLGSFRTILVPIVTIPLSIIGVCTLMQMLGYSINTITLLAWVLAIGLVVDDAIVVVENIHRHIELGKSPFDAALIGTREISFAVVAMTITLAAVYTPIGFTAGLTGKLFGEFAFTLSGAVIVSGFIALTLSPMMCSKLLNHEQTPLAKRLDRYFAGLEKAYEHSLSLLLDYKLAVIIVALLMLGIGLSFYRILPNELAPEEDQGAVQTFAQGPANANINYMAHYGNQISEIYANVPEMKMNVVLSGFPAGINSGLSKIRLIDWGQRKRSASDINKELAKQVWTIPGIKVFSFLPPALPMSGNLPFEVVFKATGAGSEKSLQRVSQQFMQQAKQYPGIHYINTDLWIDKPQVKLKLDRKLAYSVGVSMQEAADALNLLFAQPEDNQFSINDRSYYVIPELANNFAYHNNPASIDDIYVRALDDQLVPLSNVVQTKMDVAPRELNHFQQLPSVKLLGTLAPGYTLGDAVHFAQHFAKSLPKSITLDYAGQTRQFIQASGAMEEAFVFAIVFIFLVLSAQFESFRDPLIVMMTVPLSLAGAVVTLYYAGGTLNIYSQIGLITLIGLISKHGILIVEFANQLKRNSAEYTFYTAVKESARLRMRPILMTTAAMVFGALPLALASGAGANARHQLGWIIVGGMLLGTCFSLYVIPTVYLLMQGKAGRH